MNGWIEKYGLVIAFYLLIVLLIYVNRKKFEFQGKIVALYRSSVGLKLMDRMGNGFSRLVRAVFLVLFAATLLLLILDAKAVFSSFLFAFIVLFALTLEIVLIARPALASIVIIFVGFTGMAVMVFMIGLGTYNLFFKPAAPPMFSPVLPGISVPGSPITLPLIEGIIALFIVVVVHEFTHGVLSRLYGLPVKSSGFVMFGPIPGAFVEPDEKKLQRAKTKAQLAIFAGGPFANILLSAFLFLIIFGASVLSASMYDPDGIVIVGFTNQSENAAGGRLAVLSEGEVIHSINGAPIVTVLNLSDALHNLTPGGSVVLGTDKGNKTIMLAGNPENSSQPYLGIYLNHHVEGRGGTANGKVFSAVYFWFFGNPYDLRFNQSLGMLGWVFIISLGIGIVNLLPLGPMDGGRMYLLVLQKYLRKKTARGVWTATTLVLVFLLVMLILIPIIRALV
jgi:membrane-associated protease RseP (regulator of RpoE activity)